VDTPRKWFEWNGFGVFSKRLQIQIWNNLKTARRLIKIQLEIFDTCSINYSARINSTVEFFSCTSQLRLIDVELWNSFSKRLWHRRLVYLVFRISVYVEVSWNEARRSRGPRNMSCCCYPSLLHLRRRLPSIVIGVPLAALMLQSMLPTKI
jgi:hypothetical protein